MYRRINSKARTPTAPALSFPALNGGACRAPGHLITIFDLKNPGQLGAAKVKSFLEHLAVEGNPMSVPVD
jgi:hypothetical protein